MSKEDNSDELKANKKTQVSCFLPLIGIWIYSFFQNFHIKIEDPHLRLLSATFLWLFFYLRFSFLLFRHTDRKEARENPTEMAIRARELYMMRLQGFTNPTWLSIKSRYSICMKVINEFFCFSLDDMYPEIPTKPKKHILALDLDETLISSISLKNLSDDEKQKLEEERRNLDPFTLCFYDGSIKREYCILHRPYLEYFLDCVSQWYDLVIFTASVYNYAKSIKEDIDHGGYIKKLYTKADCIVVGNHYVKDLTTITEDLSNIIIIDNMQASYMNQPDNGILITSWYSESNDKELKHLLSLLYMLQFVPDVRDVLQIDYYCTPTQQDNNE
ncbi:hypothetical protein WA158_004734 [Blastocystis sp. Blastoise]